MTVHNTFFKEGNIIRPTKERETDKKIAVTAEGLAAMLSCGEATARKIGENAHARIEIGRRVLYNVSKVEQYIDNMSE